MRDPFPRRVTALRRLAVAAAVVGLIAPRGPAQPTAVTLGPAEPLPGMLYTFNTNLLTAIAFQGFAHDGPQFEAAVEQLRPRGLRFPGGTIANNYLWEKDSFSEPTNDKTGWAAEQLRLFRKIGRPYDRPGFADVCKRYDLAPIWVLNVYEETPESLGRLLDEFDRLGLKIGSVEMANEPYWDGRSFNDVRKYIDFCRPLARELRRLRPATKIGACFAPLGNGANYEAIWNAPLAKEDWFDAVVFHDYYGGQGFALEKGSKVPAAAMLDPKALIDGPVRAFAELLPGKPIWFTEWNVGAKGLDEWKNTGAELLFVAAVFDRLVRHRGAIELACFHEAFDARFGAFFFDEKRGKVETNATWQLFRLLGAATAGATALRPAALADEDVYGFGTQTGDDIRLFLVNRTAEARAVSLPPEVRGGLTRLTVECPPGAALPRSVDLVKASDADPAAVMLPAYSVNVVGPRGLLEPRSEAADRGDRLPRLPHLTLWYPPYAGEQPRFDPDGVYVVDAKKFRVKPLAVVKMNVASLKLTPGTRYALEFEAKADDPSGVAVKLPAAAAGAGGYATLHRDFGRSRYRFDYDPSANGNEITFVFPEDVLAKGPTVSFRGFRLAEAGR